MIRRRVTALSGFAHSFGGRYRGSRAGLIAVQQYKRPAAQTGSSGTITHSPPVFKEAVFRNPAIAGVDVRADWKDIDPAYNTFNWAPLT
jgi:hypothetical protein